MDHSKEFVDLVDDAKSRVREVSVAETLERIESGANLIDVREDNEWENEHAKPAKHMSRGIIERDIVNEFPTRIPS